MCIHHRNIFTKVQKFINTPYKAGTCVHHIKNYLNSLLTLHARLVHKQCMKPQLIKFNVKLLKFPSSLV